MVVVIEKNSIGRAWLALLKLIMESGHIINDGSVKLKELLNVFVNIANPNQKDTLIELFGDTKMLHWMKQNFLSLQEVENWGYSYGQRIYNYYGFNQIEYIKNKLKNNLESKSAILCLNDPPKDLKHTPCINIIDFKIRGKTVYMSTFFRSQDIFKKMYADAICLSLILKDIANYLKIKETALNLYITSAHIYKQDFERSLAILDDSVNK